jgi:hypothetical protein
MSGPLIKGPPLGLRFGEARVLPLPLGEAGTLPPPGALGGAGGACAAWPWAGPLGVTGAVPAGLLGPGGACDSPAVCAGLGAAGSTAPPLGGAGGRPPGALACGPAAPAGLLCGPAAGPAPAPPASAPPPAPPGGTLGCGPAPLRCGRSPLPSGSAKRPSAEGKPKRLSAVVGPCWPFGAGATSSVVTEEARLTEPAEAGQVSGLAPGSDGRSSAREPRSAGDAGPLWPERAAGAPASPSESAAVTASGDRLMPSSGSAASPRRSLGWVRSSHGSNSNRPRRGRGAAGRGRSGHPAPSQRGKAPWQRRTICAQRDFVARRMGVASSCGAYSGRCARPCVR